MIPLLKIAPTHSGEEILMFQEQEDCDGPYEENVFFQAWDTVLVAMNSVLMSQQYSILKKGTLNRSTHKTRAHIYQLMKILWLETWRNLTLYFPYKPWFRVLSFKIDYNYRKQPEWTLLHFFLCYSISSLIYSLNLHAPWLVLHTYDFKYNWHPKFPDSLFAVSQASQCLQPRVY